MRFLELVDVIFVGDLIMCVVAYSAMDPTCGTSDPPVSESGGSTLLATGRGSATYCLFPLQVLVRVVCCSSFAALASATWTSESIQSR
jgi:hypothetical protein